MQANLIKKLNDSQIDVDIVALALSSITAVAREKGISFDIDMKKLSILKLGNGYIERIPASLIAQANNLQIG